MAVLDYLLLAGISGFAGASFFFALAESALFSLGKWRAQQLADRSPAQGAKVAQLLSQPQDLLGTIVLGNALANACLIGFTLWFGRREGWSWAMSGTVAFLLILIGCEVIPKTLAVRNAERWSLRLAGIMSWLQTIVEPLRRIAQGISSLILRAVVPSSVKPLPAVTEQEYQELIEMAHQQGTLAQSEKEIILQVIHLDRRTVKEVMKPRSQMACISDDCTIEEMEAAARRFRHRRLPIYDESPDTIVGILNTRTFLLDPTRDLANAIEFPSFVPESMNLLQLLKSFQRQQRGLAVVLDEFGGTAGLITMEDILEKVVGELHTDRAIEGYVLEKIAEGRWRISGLVRVEDFRREYPEMPRIPGIDTMGGLFIHLLGVVPATGESTVWGGLRLTASAVDERRVKELLVEQVRKKGGTIK
ncbi:MAG: hemolysin family protein [Verrucomicrobiota bacterium]